MIILLIICLVISIASVSASDVTADNQVINASDTDTGNVGFDDVNSALKSSIDSDILSDGESAGTFSDLNSLIKGTEKDGTLTLNMNFKYNSDTDTGLVINKPITIDGNGYNIIGNNITNLINVTANNVILKNLNFIDSGSNCTNLIYWQGDNGQVINCYFYNITSRYTISFNGINEIVSNSKFYNTTSIKGTSVTLNKIDVKNVSRVLYDDFNCKFSVYDSNFTNINCLLTCYRSLVYVENIRVINSTATIKPDGGTNPSLIAVKEYFTIKDSYFEGIGGPIIIGGGVLMYNSTFKNNTADTIIDAYTRSGYYSGITIDSCNFTDNYLCVFNVCYINFNILNSVFENNNNTNIPVTQHSFIMDNCTFISNTASGDALIKFSSKADKSRVVNSKFINNDGFTIAPIYIIKGSFYQNNNEFTNNINSTGSLSSIVNTVGTVFTPIDVVYVSPNGEGDGSINSRTNLTNALNIVSFGGTIYLQSGEYIDLTDRVNLYANVIGEESDVIIKNGSFVSYLHDVIIKDITFYDMQKPIAFEIFSCNIINCTFSNCNKTSSIVYHSLGYAQGHKLINVTISNSNTTQILNYYGGDRYQSLDYTLENIMIIDSSFSGQLIDFGTVGDNVVKNITCIRSNFTGNLLNFRPPNSDKSFGHYSTIDGLILTDCIFESGILNSQNTESPTYINNIVVENCTTKNILFTGVLCTFSNITVNNSNKDYSQDIFKMSSGGYSISDVTLNNLVVGSIISSDSEYLTFDSLTVSDVSGTYGFIANEGSEFYNFNFTNVEFTNLGVLYANTILKDSSFIGYGSHLEVRGDNVEISGSTFKDGVNTGMNGGAIELMSGDNFIVNNCTFTNNRANNGGAVYINNVTNSSYIMNSIFTGNTATTKGGAIYIEKGIYYYVSENTRDTLGHNDRTNDLYKEQGVLETKDVVWVTLYGTGEGDYNDPCAFENCLDYVSPFGSIMFKGVGQPYSYSSVVNREYLKPGLKIYGNYSILSNYHFTIGSLANGVEIYDLILCNVITDSAIIWEGSDGKIVNCTFKDNGGDNIRYGAALKVVGDNLVINNTIFENNAATNSDDGFSYGGAIYCNAGGLTLNNCTFSKNTIYGYGSHIYLDENANEICINSSKFSTGKITGSSSQGSAIYICSESDLIICNSTFTGNKAVNGGALNIHATISNINIYNNTFKSNEASNNGGAIAFTCSVVNNLEMYENIYESNTATNYGGAIYSNVGFSETDSTFKSNHATDGSAIYLVGGNSLTLTRDRFENNDASSHGAVYINEGGSVYPTDVTFTGNINGNIYFAGNYVASELYVSQSGTGGGATSDDPTTLTNALQHISSGGRIILTGNLNIAAVVAITNKNIALVGNGYTITGNKRFNIANSVVNIENLTFNGFNTAGDCVVYYDSASSGSVVNVNFTNQASGTSALDIDGNVDVTNCLFKDNNVNTGALYYGSSASGTVSASTFNNTHNLYVANVNAITVSGNTFVCPSVTIDAITSTQPYHSTVTISGTFDDGTNRYSKHNVKIYNGTQVINTATLGSNNRYSYSYANLLNGDYTISLEVVSDGNTYIYTTPTRSFTISQANTIYIGPVATGDGSGVDTNNLATWDTIGTKLASNGVVYFTNGNYNLNQKTISNPWTLTASSADNVVIDGGSNTIFTVNCEGVTIENLTLTANTRLILGTSTVTVKNSVLYNQISIDSFTDPVYGDTITISGSFGNIALSSLEAYSGDELIGSTTISGSATTYTITRNGNLAVGSYTLSATKKSPKRRII